MSARRLPIEILEIITRKAAETKTGREWIGQVDESGKQCWDHPLRALSQTCRALRRVVLPLIWEEIVIDAPGEDWNELRRQVRLLIKVLNPKVDKLVRKTCKAWKFRARAFRQPRAVVFRPYYPARLIRDVHVNVAWPEECEDEGVGGDGGEHETSLSDLVDIGSPPLTRPIVATRYYEYEFRTTRHTSSVLMRKLSQALTCCRNLRCVTWCGWLAPDEMLISHLASIPSLLAFEIDLGPWAVVNQTHDGWQIESDNVQWNRLTFSNTLSIEEHLESSQVEQEYCDHCEDSYHLGRLLSYKGASTVDWLISIGLPTHYSLAIPELLRQTWMVPLWAQVEHLVWHHERALTLEELETTFEWEREDAWMENWPWREWNQDEVPWCPNLAPLFHAAATFRGHLLISVPYPNDGAELIQAARIVFSLIHDEPDLAPWREWFPDWHSTDPVDGGETTQTVLKKVVRALFRNV